RPEPAALGRQIHAGGGIEQVAAVHGHATGRRPEQPRDAPKHRGLPRARRPNQGERLGADRHFGLEPKPGKRQRYAGVQRPGRRGDRHAAPTADTPGVDASAGNAESSRPLISSLTVTRMAPLTMTSRADMASGTAMLPVWNCA